MSAGTTSAPIDLTVVSCPEKHLAFTNYVYCSLTDKSLLKSAKSNENWLAINQFIYNVAGHKLINPGELGLSAVQRETLKVSQGSQLTVKSWSPPKDGSSNLIELTLLVELMGGGRKSLKEDDLIEHCLTNYLNQTLTKDQIIVADFLGTALKLIVQQLQVPKPIKSSKSKTATANDIDDDDDGSITQYSNRGILLSSTDITIVAEESKFLKLEKKAKKKNVIFDPNWSFEKMNIGGLDSQFNTLFRRAFASRIFPHKVIAELGIKHVKGILLFGPPGTGKTLIARQIGKMLTTREPKIINGPEILNKFVGASEENIRNQFKDAEADYKANKENADLHIIIFDEIDAICKARGTRGGDSGVGDTVVNQLLTKIDGVESLDNILVIGMTNRKDLIDPALLRPGRLEVHIEISLPDEKGRRQIFNIHTNAMRAAGRLGKDVSIDYLASVTKNYSGAEIEGCVKNASSYALYSSIDVTKGDQVTTRGDDKGIIVTMEHFQHALDECKPAFGVDEDEIKQFITGDLLNYGTDYEKIISTATTRIELVKRSTNSRLQSLLLYGPSGAGKTSIAAKLALESEFPYVKIISPTNYVGINEATKVREIAKIFEDAYKSPLSLIVVDNIERLIEYVPVGPRFSANLLQTLLVLCNNPPPNTKSRLMVIGTSSHLDMIESLGFHDVFMNEIEVQALEKAEQVRSVLDLLQVECKGGDKELELMSLQAVEEPIAIKRLLAVVDTCKLAGNVNSKIWEDALKGANKSIKQYKD